MRTMKMAKRAKAVRLIVACLVLSLPAIPCSSFTFLNRGCLFFGANYDNVFAPGKIFINRRNVRKTGWEPGTSGKTAAWISRYGSLVIACAGYQLAWGGMNEAGLCFSTMLLAGTRAPAADERPPLVGAFWWQYILDTCATVEELREAAKTIRIADTQDHYLVADRTGACAVVECLEGRLIIRAGKDLPVAALTNSPYPASLDFWTSRAKPPAANPGSSLARFSRLADGLAKYSGGTPAAPVDYAFGLLAGVAAGPATRWSFVCDTGARVFYLKSYANSRVRFVDLKKIDFACDRPTAMLDAHAGLEGDITASFHAYSHEEALALMVKSLKYFRPGTEDDMILRLLTLFESFSCRPQAGAPARD